MNVNSLFAWMKVLDRQVYINTISYESQRNDLRCGNKREKQLRMLKFQDVLDSNILITGIAIIMYTANKSSCNSLATTKTAVTLLMSIFEVTPLCTFKRAVSVE